MSEPRFLDNRLREPLRQHSLEAGPYHPRGGGFGQWPPISPVPSQLGREGLGVQTFPPQPPGGSSGTNHSTRCCPLRTSPRVDQLGPLRQLASCLCLRRPVSALIRGGRFPALAQSGRLAALVRGGLFPAPIRGQLASILVPSRGPSCRGTSLGKPLWARSSAWSGHRPVGYRMP